MIFDVKRRRRQKSSLKNSYSELWVKGMVLSSLKYVCASTDMRNYNHTSVICDEQTGNRERYKEQNRLKIETIHVQRQRIYVEYF